MSAIWATLTTRKDVAVLFYSLDLPKVRIYERLLCRTTEITYRQLVCVQKSTDQDKQHYSDGKAKFEEALTRLRVVERDYGSHVVRRETDSDCMKNGLSFAKIISDCNGLLRDKNGRNNC